MPAVVSPQLPTFGARNLLCGVVAGVGWGVLLSGGLLAMMLYRCGGICVGDIIETTSLSVLAGLATMGPLAAFRAVH